MVSFQVGTGKCKSYVRGQLGRHVEIKDRVELGQDGFYVQSRTIEVITTKSEKILRENILANMPLNAGFDVICRPSESSMIITIMRVTKVAFPILNAILDVLSSHLTLSQTYIKPEDDTSSLRIRCLAEKHDGLTYIVEQLGESLSGQYINGYNLQISLKKRSSKKKVFDRFNIDVKMLPKDSDEPTIPGYKIVSASTYP